MNKKHQFFLAGPNPTQPMPISDTEYYIDVKRTADCCLLWTRSTACVRDNRWSMNSFKQTLQVSNVIRSTLLHCV